jgi:putative oxidoreductase
VKIAVWIVSGLLSVLFLFAGGTKLLARPEVLETFTRYGHGDAFRLFVGAAEIAGAIGLWLPRLEFWAALGLIAIMLGAIYTHVTNGEAMFGPLVIALVLGFVAWARSRRALFLS